MKTIDWMNLYLILELYDGQPIPEVVGRVYPSLQYFLEEEE